MMGTSRSRLKCNARCGGPRAGELTLEPGEQLSHIAAGCAMPSPGRESARRGRNGRGTTRARMAQISPARRYSTSEPATATLRLAPVRDHGDLDGQVDQFERLRWDTRALLAENGNRASRRDAQVGEPDRLVRQLDGDDLRAAQALIRQPAADVAAHPVHTGRSTQGVAAGQRLADPRPPRDGETGADRVARSQQCAEIDLVLRPEGRDDQMVPTRVRSAPALLTQFAASSHPWRTHRAAGSAALLNVVMVPFVVDCNKADSHHVEGASRRTGAIIGGERSHDVTHHGCG